MREALNTMGALLLGRLTYEIWAGYWPTVTDPSDEIARLLKRRPQARRVQHPPSRAPLRLVDATMTSAGLVTLVYEGSSG